MANYFFNFPTTFYINADDNNNLDVVTDITKRVAFQQEFKKNSAAYFKISVTDDDTPEILADKFYNDVEKHWIILMLNDIIDPQFDWPLKYGNLINFIENKYSANANTTIGQSGIDWAQSNNQAYYKIETKTIVQTGQITKEKVFVDANTYANISTSSSTYNLNDGYQLTVDVTKEALTYFDYEVEYNDEKRNIIVLRPEFVEVAIDDLKNIFTLSQ
jgi:hypothetical protein